MASRPDDGPPERGRPYRSLRGHGEFSRAYRKGVRRRSGAVTAIVVEGPPGPATVGFVAGKRIGSAVFRNRAKRRLREAATRCRLKADTVYVLVADRGVATADFDRLVEWVRAATESNVSEELG